MPTLAGTLDVMRPFLPQALVTADAFERACAAVEHLQPEITDGIHFECRLHARSIRVDLVIIVREEGGVLLAAPPTRTSSGIRREDPGRRHLAAFCRRWTASRTRLHDLIEHVWLEYDVEPRTAGIETGPPAPGVFCRLRAPHRRTHSAQDLCRRTLTVVEVLTGRPASRVVRDCVATSVAQLPAEAAIPYIGFMAGRRTPTVRVCVAKVPAADAAGYLAATASVTGRDVVEVADRAALADGVGGPWYVPMLHLDIDERSGFLPRIGIERPFAQSCQLAGSTGDEELDLLDGLVAQGLCTRAKRDALLTWPGRSAAMMPHDLGWSLVERRINHVKFVHEPGSGTETKGYLFARYYRRRERR